MSLTKSAINHRSLGVRYKLKYFLILFFLCLTYPSLAETKIDYYVNLGGIKIADAQFIINTNEDNWSLETKVEAAGIIDVFVKFISTTSSKGVITNGKIIPDAYEFSYLTGRGSSRKGEINYENGLPTKLIAEPNYSDDEKPSLEFLEKYGEMSSDPYSALLVHGSYSDPCKYTAKGFDGLRSFKTIFIRQAREDQIEIGDTTFVVSKCVGYFEPIVGYRESDFLDAISNPGSVRYWFKFIESLNLWVPLKVIIDTPLGGFVLKAKSVSD